MRVAVVYWSGTGNTKVMAEALGEAIRNAGAEANLLTSGEFGTAKVTQYDAFALGCPSMGDEVLEESEFAPMYDAVEGALQGKRVVLFGSYGWGDGEWMRNWEARARGNGLDVVLAVIANEAPDAGALAELAAVGAKLAG